MPASISKTLLACSLLAALYMLISHPCINFRMSSPGRQLPPKGMGGELGHGRPYNYGHTCNNQFLYGDGYLWARMIE